MRDVMTEVILIKEHLKKTFIQQLRVCLMVVAIVLRLPYYYYRRLITFLRLLIPLLFYIPDPTASHSIPFHRLTISRIIYLALPSAAWFALL